MIKNDGYDEFRTYTEREKPAKAKYYVIDYTTSEVIMWSDSLDECRSYVANITSDIRADYLILCEA